MSGELLCFFKEFDLGIYQCGNQIKGMIFEPVHEKTNNLHMRKQRRRSASR